MPKWLQYYIGWEGSLGTPKSDNVIYAQHDPLCCWALCAIEQYQLVSCSVLCQVLCCWAKCASGQYHLEYWQWRNTCRPLTLPCIRRQNWKRNWRRNSQNMKIQRKLKQNVKYEKGKTENKQRKIYSSEKVAFFTAEKKLRFFSCGKWCINFEKMKCHFKACPKDART